MEIFPISQNLVGIAFHLTQPLKKLLFLFVPPNPKIPALQRSLQPAVEILATLKDVAKTRTRAKEQLGFVTQLKTILRGTVDGLGWFTVGNACYRAVLAVMRRDLFVEKCGRVRER